MKHHRITKSRLNLKRFSILFLSFSSFEKSFTSFSFRFQSSARTLGELLRKNTLRLNFYNLSMQLCSLILLIKKVHNRLLIDLLINEEKLHHKVQSSPLPNVSSLKISSPASSLKLIQRKRFFYHLDHQKKFLHNSSNWMICESYVTLYNTREN